MDFSNLKSWLESTQVQMNSILEFAEKSKERMSEEQKKQLDDLYKKVDVKNLQDKLSKCNSDISDILKNVKI
jgi:DNA gyrase/topoisomerase IV subunit B